VVEAIPLKACPFCGKPGIIVETEGSQASGSAIVFRPECSRCDCELSEWTSSKAEAIAAWNDRPAHRIEATASTATADGLADEELARWVEAQFPGSVAFANDPAEFSHLIELTPERLRSILAALRQPAIEAAPEGEVEKLIATVIEGTQWAITAELTRLQAENARLKAIEATRPVTSEVEGLRILRDEFQRWLDRGPNAQPHYHDGVRPFSTGDLKFFVAALSAALSDAPNPVGEGGGHE